MSAHARLRDRLEQIGARARSVSGATDLPVVFAQVGSALRGLRPQARGAIWLVDREDGSCRRVESDESEPVGTAEPTIEAQYAAAIVESRQPLVGPGPRPSDAAPTDAGPRSYYGVPIEAAGDVLGVLGIVFDDVAPLTPDERDIIGTLASQLAVACRNALLCAENEAHRLRTEALTEVGRLLAEAVDLATVARRIADCVASLLEARAGVVYRVLADTQHLETLAVAGKPESATRLGSVVPAGLGPAGLAGRDRTTVATPDSAADARFAAGPTAHQAVLAIPLLVKDVVIGVLSVEDKPGRAFTEDDILLAQGFAHQAAVALQNARLFRDALDRLAETETLLAMAAEFAHDVPPEEALRRVVRLMARALGADMTGAYFLDRANEALVPVAGYHVPPHLLATFLGSPFPLSRFSFLREAWDTGRLVWTSDYMADARFDQAFLAELRPTSLLFAPTRVRGDVVGGLFLVWWSARRHFEPAELRLLEGIATQVGLALENAYGFKHQRDGDAAAGAERRFQALVEQSADAVTLVSESGVIQYASPVVTHLLGYAVEELVGRSACDLAHPDDVAAMMATFRELVGAPGRRLGGQCRLRHKDGSWRWVEGTGTNLLGEPSVQAIVGSYRDVTQRKEAEAARRMEVAGQLAGGVAHDFNNLLTVILGRSRLLRRRLPPDETLRREVDLIETTAVRAAALTGQLLAFSRRQVLRPEVLDVNAVVANFVPTVRRFVGDDIVVVALPAAHPALVRADLDQLEQIMMHLTLNARDAMTAGGTLALAVATRVLDDAFVRDHPDAHAGPYVMLTVRDTGHGMSSDVQSRAFEPFFTTKGDRGRAGLGLSTVFGVVKQHGGLITVESGLDHGTTFGVYLPETTADARARREPPAVRGSETILLVDDEDHVRELTRDMLLMSGYVVLEARHGAEALAVSERHAGPIGLLLTDVVMPGLSGPELSKQLLRTRPGLRVLYVSGYPADAILDRGVPPGFTLLHKPFRQEDLARLVREVLAPM